MGASTLHKPAAVWALTRRLDGRGAQLRYERGAEPFQRCRIVGPRPDDGRIEVNAADKQRVIDPEALRRALVPLAGLHGAAKLRRLLDRRTFTLTDSHFERRFLPLARRAGLSKPLTGVRLNGFKVDFYWPELGLVVETDGLRYHRTPAEQARDRVRDQAHAVVGLTPLRFTRAQVAFEPAYVHATWRPSRRV